MKRLIILGAGTAGTMIANKLIRRLPRDWTIQIVDASDHHLYQPGLLFVPFNREEPDGLTRPISELIPDGVEFVQAAVDKIRSDEKMVDLADGRELSYDELVIATGTSPRPEQTPGMSGPEWRRTIHEFYTLEGATALRDVLETWEGGRLVVHICETPIKCPVAPLEFAFLADAEFRERGIRQNVDLTFVTPLPGAFTKPVASAHLGGMLEERSIEMETDFMVERIEANHLVSYDERRIPFDLLVTVPVNMGASFVGRSGIGDELDHIRVDPATFSVRNHDHMFAIGDAAALPTSKAGSAAHFSVDVFVDNFIDHISGRPMSRSYDGHTNCFVEAGDGKALLIDFNYEVQPLPGTYPIPRIGPLRLLRETRLNHLGKLAFKPMYWHLLLRGRKLPVPNRLSMAGKIQNDLEKEPT